MGASEMTTSPLPSPKEREEEKHLFCFYYAIRTKEAPKLIINSLSKYNILLSRREKQIELLRKLFFASFVLSL